MKKLLPAIIGGIVLVVLAIMILFSPDTNQSDSNGSSVAATIFPIYDITTNITGDAIGVQLILPAGASPHTFDPSPSSIRDIENADVIYSIGHGLDDWTQTLVQAVGADSVVVDDGIEIRSSDNEDEHEDEHEENEDEHEDEEDGHGHGPDDPHYYLTIPNAKIVASTITKDLSNRYPQHAETFQANLQTYLNQLDTADAEIRESLSEVENKNLITLHDAWYYFAKEYDLVIIGSFEPSPGREPTPQYLAELSDALNASQTTTLYTEPQLGTQNIQAFIEDNDLSIAELDPIGGLENRSSYIELMKYNAQVIQQNQ